MRPKVESQDGISAAQMVESGTSKAPATALTARGSDRPGRVDMTDSSARFEAAMRAGLKWLYETPQPPDAILQHHGDSIYIQDANRGLRFVPRGWERHTVIVVDVARVEWGGRHEPPRNPLAVGELDRCADLLRRLGHHVCHTWNGKGITGSIALSQPAHPSLLAAVEKYHTGCVEHSGGVFCKCTWYADGNQKLVHIRDLTAVGGV